MGLDIERSEASSPKSFTLSRFTRKELIVIFSLCVTLLVCIIFKCVVDYHWNTPETEVIQSVSPTQDFDSQQIKVQLDINKAEWYELVLLPKIGEVRAKAIVAYRKKYGEFQDINQLLSIKGINSSVIEAIKDYVLVGNSQ